MVEAGRKRARCLVGTDEDDVRFHDALVVQAHVDGALRGVFSYSMDITELAKAYRRRADAREADRRARYDELRGQARRIAAALRERFGEDVRVYLFGSLLEPDRFRGSSDIDLAVEGLEPAEYWKAWSVADRLASGATVDFVRLESASDTLREHVRRSGEALT